MRLLNVLTTSALLTIGSVSLAQPDLTELKGFTLVTSTYVDGDFEGADFDKVVKLDNGMIFQFNTYSYTYSYHPAANVFAQTFSVAALKRLKVKNPTAPVTLYRLVIGDSIYSVDRIK